MKNSRRGARSGSLVALLAKNYLAFTLVLLALVGGVYLLWNTVTDSLLSGTDVAALQDDPAVSRQRYDQVAVKKYLGANGAFAVFSPQGKAVYTSEPGFGALSADELACVPFYRASGGQLYYNILPYTDEAGRACTLVAEQSYGSTESQDSARIMLLDENLNVVSGGLIPGKTSYTQAELDLLTQQDSGSGLLYRLSLQDGRTLLVRVDEWGIDEYSSLMQRASRVWLILLPLYIAAALGFILWLNALIRRPLSRLDAAIVSLGEGRPAKAGNCGGPREIRALGENFDIMAGRLAESEAERRRLDDERQKLLADISHDLKTPITVIAGYTGAIRDGRVPAEEIPRYLEVIDSKAAALNGLINTFYEYSRTQHPDFRLECLDTDLCEFLREYLARKYDEIDLAGFSLEVDIPETPVHCSLDAFQFGRALDNLLNNTLRYNALGTLIRVRLSVLPGWAVLVFADNGTGIPAGLREHLFDPFTVGDEARGKGGSGLGLAITKKIVEAHGGSIRLMEVPEGTAYELRLPVFAQPPAVKAAANK